MNVEKVTTPLHAERESFRVSPAEKHAQADWGEFVDAEALLGELEE